LEVIKKKLSYRILAILSNIGQFIIVINRFLRNKINKKLQEILIIQLYQHLIYLLILKNKMSSNFHEVVEMDYHEDGEQEVKPI